MSISLSPTLQLTLKHQSMRQAYLRAQYPLQVKNVFISFVFNSLTSHIWCNLQLKPDPSGEKLLFIMGFCLLRRDLNLETRPTALRIFFLVKISTTGAVSDSDPKQIQSYMKPNFYFLAWYKEIVGRIENAF